MRKITKIDLSGLNIEKEFYTEKEITLDFIFKLVNDNASYDLFLEIEDDKIFSETYGCYIYNGCSSYSVKIETINLV